MKIYLPTNYYRQFSGDHTKPYPAESYGGWQKEMLPIETDTTAIVCMHAWDTGEDGEYPGWERCVDYIPRASKICRKDMPPFFEKVRKTPMKLIHVAAEGQVIEHFPGWQRTLELCGDEKEPYRDPAVYINGDEAVNEIRNFKYMKGHVGEENIADVARGCPRKVNPYVLPKDDEFVVTKSYQLRAICEKYNIRHLIYTGFAINMCLFVSPCGMLDMGRYGIMCSAVRELTTAVENRESARGEKNKEYGLWHTALLYGFVYNKEDIEKYVLEELAKRER
ncbi:MAG: hypothetical protein E7665_10170 [Ruminococcaceae bacterium]|nr:hypothetical protein [Oscillospiraceae bacterium]